MDRETLQSTKNDPVRSLRAVVVLLGLASIGWFLVSFTFGDIEPPIAYARPIRHELVVHLPLLVGLALLLASWLLYSKE